MMDQEEQIQLLKSVSSKHPILFRDSFFSEYLTDSPAAFHDGLLTDYFTHDKLLVACPRGSAKTTVTCLFYAAFCAVSGRKKYIQIVSDTYSRAARILSRLANELIANVNIQAVFEKQQSDTWREDFIRLANGCVIEAIGSGQQIRGAVEGKTRPDLIIIDDFENDERVKNKELRDADYDWIFASLLPSRERRGSQVIFLGTILHHDSVLNRFFTTADETWHKIKYKLLQDDNTSLWPSRFPIEEIIREREEYAKMGKLNKWSQEYQNEPMQEEDAIFKREYFKYYVNIPKLKTIYVSVDPAISLAQSADYTAITAVGIDENNYWYILDRIRGHLTPDDTVTGIFSLSEKWNPNRILIETVQYQQALAYMLRAKMREQNKFWKIEEIKNSKQKELRIQGLSAVYAQGAIFHRQGNDEKDLEDELLSFPFGVHDDCADSLANILQVANPSYITHKKDETDKWSEDYKIINKFLEKKKTNRPVMPIL